MILQRYAFQLLEIVCMKKSRLIKAKSSSQCARSLRLRVIKTIIEAFVFLRNLPCGSREHAKRPRKSAFHLSQGSGVDK